MQNKYVRSSSCVVRGGKGWLPTFGTLMEGIGGLLNEEFGIGFGADCEIPTRVVSLVTVGVGGALARIELEGIFKYLPRISLGRRQGKSILGLGVISIEETLWELIEPNLEIACPNVVPQNEAVGPNMVETRSSRQN